jgi:streptomycin 6-kinase
MRRPYTAFEHHVRIGVARSTAGGSVGEDPPVDLPATFRARLTAVHGEDGTAWLDALPATIDRWRARWDLHALRSLPPSYGWVAAAERRDGTPCVLKLVPPGAETIESEAAWLALADGRGAARLLASAPDAGALLLERLQPGTPLAALVPDRDEEACAILAAVIAALPGPAALPTLAARTTELADHLAGAADPLPGGVVALADRVARELLATAGPDVPLHGDLHHDNVLRDGDAWRAIDPHGLRGDPAYEIAPLLYNPLPLGPAVATLAAGRCRRLAALTGLPEDRLRAWGFVQAVLSAVWSLDEDPEPDAHVLAVAEVLAP